MAIYFYIPMYVALAVVGVWVLIRKECWKPSKVVGPNRWEEDENPALLMMLAGSGFLAWLMAAQFFMARPEGSTTAPASAPTTRSMDIGDVKAGTRAQLIGLATLLAGNLAIRKNGLKTLGVGKPWKGVLPGLGAAAIALPLVFVTGLGAQVLWKLIHFEHPEKHEVLDVLLKAPVAERWIPIVSAVIAAPLFEEFLFRGHLQTFFKRIFHTRGSEVPAAWVSILLASGGFMVVHPSWTYPMIFVLSVCMGYVYERTGNIWSTIVLHMIFNGAQVTFSMLLVGQ